MSVRLPRLPVCARWVASERLEDRAERRRALVSCEPSGQHVLSAGAMPLDVLAMVVDDYIASREGAPARSEIREEAVWKTYTAMLDGQVTR